MKEASVSGATGRSVRYIAAMLAIAAGVIHFGVAPEHFTEALEFGVFMVAVGTAQIAAGILLAVRPSCKLIIATVVGTLLVSAVYAVSRTVGLPFGPDPWHPEEVQFVDVISKATEFALLIALVPLAGGCIRRRASVPSSEDDPGAGNGSGQHG